MSRKENLLTEEDVIDLLGLHNRRNPLGALRWLCRTGQLTYVQLGRGIRRFRPEDVQRFVDRKTIEAQDA